jgi:hypothetical protein
MVNDPIVLGSAGETAESLADQRRAKDAKRKRDERAAKQNAKRAASNQTREEWFAGNRALLAPTELEKMVEVDADIRDLMVSMETITDVSLDPELVDIIVESVKENGVAHLGYVSKNDLPGDWSGRQYWRSADLMKKLVDEGWQTEQFIRFGFLAALPDWQVAEFLQKKAGWSFDKTAALLGYKYNGLGPVTY